MTSKDSIGVLGQYSDARSGKDQYLNLEFNKCTNLKEGFNNDAIGVLGPDGPRRSVMDRMLQREFDPMVGKESYAPAGSGFATPLSNPNNPMSAYASYVRLS